MCFPSYAPRITCVSVSRSVRCQTTALRTNASYFQASQLPRHIHRPLLPEMFPMTKLASQLRPIAWLYLALAIVGAASTWSYNLLAMRELGDAFTPQAFVRIGFEGSPLLGSLASDFWVGSLASLIWMVSEGMRLRMKRIWMYVVLTFLIAWAFALPLFLFMRERHIARQPS